MKNRKRVAILFHKNDRHYNLDRYTITHLAGIWREAGHEVVLLFGPGRFVPADLIVVHVNLSLVPDEYIQFARQYPLALNAEIKDIRKRTISRSLLERGDNWAGAVIVKSNLNYAGDPEFKLGRSWLVRRSRILQRTRRFLDRSAGRLPLFADSTDYELYNRLADVPGRYFDRDDVVIEKFHGEIEDGLYHTRFYLFLGDHGRHRRLAAEHPVVNRMTHVRTEDIEPNDRIIEWRRRLKLDYGKLDYVLVDGEVIVLDVNKTIGASRPADDEGAQRFRRYLAEGLYSYFEHDEGGG